MKIDPGHEPFLAAIREAPEDDARRLVYADWLDDRSLTEESRIVRAEAGLDLENNDPFDAWLLQVARTKYEYRGWRRKYPQAWVRLISRTLCGELIVRQVCSTHGGYEHRFCLVVAQRPEGVLVTRLFYRRTFDLTEGENDEFVYSAICNPHLRITSAITDAEEAKELKGFPVPCFELQDQRYLFWDGKL